MKHLVLALLILVALAGADGCGTGTAEPSWQTAVAEPSSAGASSAEPAPVRLSLHATRSDGGLRLTGKTNLPDGAVIVYEVHQVNGAWITDDIFVKVKDGRYSSVVQNVPSGKLEAWLAFAPGPVAQPRAVVKLYGKNGKRIPNGVAQYGGSFRVEITATVN